MAFIVRYIARFRALKASLSVPSTPSASVFSGSDDDVLAVIPARYGSTRFPGKPLATLHGQPMLWHVWQRVCQTPSVARVIIATDDERIAEVAQAFGAEVAMTDPQLPSGTDRVWAVAEKETTFPWVLNVQGDEPQVDPVDLATLITACRETPWADVGTLASPIHTQEETDDANIVKVVMDDRQRALYFSRFALPYHRASGRQVVGDVQRYRHVGVYCYRRPALARFTSQPATELEQAEALEQLRGLAIGLQYRVVLIPKAPAGVDCPEDLARLHALEC
jgi:3-deoxy-manno-octulosonate cytidylyltransferase (CMP-KDO synthetase)